MPNLKTPYSEINFDKVAHIVFYIPFGFLLARGLKHSQTQTSKRILSVAVLIFSMAYGISDEFHQSFVPGRAAGLDDVLADTIGGFIGGLIYLR